MFLSDPLELDIPNEGNTFAAQLGSAKRSVSIFVQRLVRFSHMTAPILRKLCARFGIIA
jgi:hypothetical protein